MILDEEHFRRLIGEAWRQPFTGWDFVHLSGRMIQASPSWDYRRLVMEKMAGAESLLDLDTGGGEFLSSLAPFPARTYATEGYFPNVPIARARLAPLGVRVVDARADGPLPFDDDTFDLVIDRHGDLPGPELRRILRPGKRFITQQVGGRNNIRLNEMLQSRVEFRDSYWTLEAAVRQLQSSGLLILKQREEFPPVEFTDIGAVVYYLKAIPWQVEGFAPEAYYDRLGEIHNIILREGKFVCASHRFYLEAQKPQR